jgi:putative ABC transport system permease protein
MVPQQTRFAPVTQSAGADSKAPQPVVGLIARQTAYLAAAGLVLGLAVALVSARLLSSLLYEVSATDPATFAAVSAVVFGVAMLAAFLAARRATAISPGRGAQT